MKLNTELGNRPSILTSYKSRAKNVFIVKNRSHILFSVTKDLYPDFPKRPTESQIPNTAPFFLPQTKLLKYACYSLAVQSL